MFNSFKCYAKSSSISDEFGSQKKWRLPGLVIVAATVMLAVGSSSADEEYPDVLVSFQVKENGETSVVYGPGHLQSMAHEKMMAVPEGLFEIPESLLNDLENGGEIVDFVIVYEIEENGKLLHRARRRCHTHRNGERHCPG